MQELVLIRQFAPLRTSAAGKAAQAVRRREFEARLAECGPLAFRVARGVLRNDADAEDVAQEALLRAYRRLTACAMRGDFADGWCALFFDWRWIGRVRQSGGSCAKRNGRSRPGDCTS